MNVYIYRKQRGKSTLFIFYLPCFFCKLSWETRDSDVIWLHVTSSFLLYHQLIRVFFFPFPCESYNTSISNFSQIENVHFLSFFPSQDCSYSRLLAAITLCFRPDIGSLLWHRSPVIALILSKSRLFSSTLSWIRIVLTERENELIERNLRLVFACKTKIIILKMKTRWKLLRFS